MPKNLEFSELSGFHIVNSFDDLNATIIHESVSTGFDEDQDLAALKSIVEYLERRAFVEGFKLGDPACQTERTDGLAAFPVNGSPSSALLEARKRALAEAVERYAWATWWDNTKIKSEILLKNEIPKLTYYHDELNSILPISESIIVKPLIASSALEVLIIVCFLKNGGAISGGACGALESRPNTLKRAFAEISRHALAVSRFHEMKAEPKSFYEKRLLHFAGFNGGKAVRDRISFVSDSLIELPKLKIDQEVKHSLSEVVCAYRCLFEDQPAFISGDLERFCI